MKIEQYFTPCGRVLLCCDALCGVCIYRSANSLARCFVKQTVDILKSKVHECANTRQIILVFFLSRKSPFTQIKCC